MKKIILGLSRKWRDRAIASREEAGRIRRTIGEPTGAEERCNVRAEVWDQCANDIADAIRKLKEEGQ